MNATRQSQLEELAHALQRLESSPLYAYRAENRYLPVLGEGNPEAAILLIGEAPGEWEAKSGRPFVGASGRLLDTLLESVGLQRADVYITNVVKDRPPENRAPTAAEIRIYAPFLDRQIDIIRPRVIATLGRFAMDYIFGLFEMPQRGQKITQLHGSRLAAQAPYGPVTVVPLYHPAVALYTVAQRETLAQDFKVLQALKDQAAA